jgi:hypothetical protein
MTTTPPPEPQTPPADDRWPFIRDVLIVQLKLVLGNLQNLLLVPISIGAALIDLVFKGERQGERFYKVLKLGRYADEAINLYGAVGGYHAAERAPEDADLGSASGKSGPPSAVDSVIRRVEDAIVREYQKGGTAASVKTAVDRVLDQLQREDKNKSGNGGSKPH